MHAADHPGQGRLRLRWWNRSPRATGLAGAIGACVVSGLASAGALACPSDFDGTGDVGFSDLAALLAAWGGCPGCAEDVDGSGAVGFADLSALLAAWGDCPAADTVAIELAGRPLDRYPFVEFVRTFEAGESVAVAIDPRFLDGASPTCDVYIVPSRTPADWAANDTLTDVRGAPQPTTFGGSTVQANTFTLTGSTGLNGDAGTALGVGYDVVCDCNANGALDSGDFIDGLGAEAGFYVMRDPTLPGPLAVTSTVYSVSGGSVPSGFEAQKIYYPTAIASMGELPFVSISHGNGHQYTWYDYLGEHLASYGYVVMSHRNDTIPGMETASTTTYRHTDAFLGQLGSIAGGALAGHVDGGRIIWIGHSRGGEGVVRAYTRVRDGLVTTQNYTADDVVLVSSIAPVNGLGSGSSEPGDVNYHLIWGSADGDVSGSGTLSARWSFAIFERATGFRQSTYVHGADHNDFNCCGFEDFTGPAGTAIGRGEAQRVAKAVYLALLERYIEGSVAAQDLLWRQTEDFSPDAIAASTVVVNDYREPSGLAFVIDDFQTNPASSVSSSGGAVSFTVQNTAEAESRDIANGYAWNSSEPMNGMARGTSGDDPRSIVFDWSTGADRYIEFEIIASERDLSDDTYLAFRACQGTRHPNTTAELGDLTFTVTLRDGAGATSSIDIGAYGGGIEEVYQRSGGWQNEFEVVRIRLTDFLANGAALDLTDVVAVRFDVGASFGAAQGRLGLDDVLISSDASPAVPGALAIGVPNGSPELLSPDAPTSFDVTVGGAAESLVPDSGLLRYRFDGGAFEVAPLVPIGGNLFRATIPPPLCGETPEFYLSAEGTESGLVVLPVGAPGYVFTADVGVKMTAFVDDFETDAGWTTENLGATSGDWQRGAPVDDDGWEYDPASDADGSGQCFLTQNQSGNTDVDLGAVRLTSPAFDLTASGAVIEYAYFLRLTETDGSDRLLVEINGNDGAGVWTTVAIHGTDGGLGWRTHRIPRAEIAGAGVALTTTMRIRFTANDADAQSIVEAGIDAFTVSAVECN